MTFEEYKRLRDKGKECLIQGNSEKAVEYFSRAINKGLDLLQENNSEFSSGFIPHEIRIQCSTLQDHDSKACSSCSKFLELAVCYSNRSLAYCNLKLYEKALLDSEETIKLAHDWPKVKPSFFGFLSIYLGIFQKG
jgi:tetratricopeptide (TPR) repeat protein